MLSGRKVDHSGEFTRTHPVLTPRYPFAPSHCVASGRPAFPRLYLLTSPSSQTLRLVLLSVGAHVLLPYR